jgi:hypothetical protein
MSALAMRLGAVRGIRAVVLGGSHARGRAQPGSDIDGPRVQRTLANLGCLSSGTRPRRHEHRAIASGDRCTGRGTIPTMLQVAS